MKGLYSDINGPRNGNEVYETRARLVNLHNTSNGTRGNGEVFAVIVIEIGIKFATPGLIPEGLMPR